MTVRVGVALLLLLAGCSSSSHCGTAVRPHTAELVTVGLANGAIRATAPVANLGAASADPPGTTWRLRGLVGRHLATLAGVAVVLGSDHQLRGVGSSDGRPLWNARVDHQLLARVATVDGPVVFAAGAQAQGEPGDRVYAIEVRTGRLLWSRTLLLDATAQRLTVVGGRLLTAVTHSVSGAHAELGSLDLRTGDSRWTTTLPRSSVVRMTGSAGGVAVLTADAAPGCS